MGAGNRESGIGNRSSNGVWLLTIPYSPFPIPVSKGDY